jgi:acetylglutamate kinase
METYDNADILIEALPYIKKYNGKCLMIKFGGNILTCLDNIVEDIVFLKHMGLFPVIVHGGGPNIDSELLKNGITPKFINGLRYTDEKTIMVVEKIFDSINSDIVKRLNSQSLKSETLANLITVKELDPSLGLVGKITSIDKFRILNSIKSSNIPVISPLGRSKEGKLYNINADTVAAEIAVSIQAENLTILTNVDGIKINEKLISHLDFKTAQEEIKKGSIKEGMIPKVEACIQAVKNNCNKAHLINGFRPHSLLLEIFTENGIGTEIVK